MKEEDTKHIYYYSGTYKCSEPSTDDELGLDWVPVSRDDTTDADEFERTYTVLFYEKGPNKYNVTKDFIVTAVRESQASAVSFVFKKYNVKR